MMVRVFMPRETDPTDGTSNGIDYRFPGLPSIGHLLRFTGTGAGDFVVSNVGFVQVGDAFVAAVWLEGTGSKPPSAPKPIAPSAPIDQSDDQYRYRDLNYDVPPESMTGY